MKKSEITNQELLQAINQNVDNKIGEVLVTINTFADEINQELGSIKHGLSDVKGVINTRLVTKSDLDDKFSEFGVEHNKKHKRVEKLTNVLYKKKILNVAETQIVLARLDSAKLAN